MGAVLTAEQYGKEIERKTAAIKEFAAQRQNELDILAKVVGANLSFVQRLSSTIARVAEAEGYSLVLNLATEDKNRILFCGIALGDITEGDPSIVRRAQSCGGALAERVHAGPVPADKARHRDAILFSAWAISMKCF